MMERQEVWQAFNTGNLSAPEYEASNLGRVRLKATKEIVQPSKRGRDISPHVEIVVNKRKLWFRPEVIIKAVFGEMRKLDERVMPAVPGTDWDGPVTDPSFARRAYTV
jgi:hypothetical protein